MNSRICFLCSNPLSYDDYVATNLSIEEFLVYTKIVEKSKLVKIIFKKAFKKHELVKLWQSNDIELACCHCRRFLDTLLNEKEALWKLLEEFEDIRLDTLKRLGIINQSDLLALKNKKEKKI